MRTLTYIIWTVVVLIISAATGLFFTYEPVGPDNLVRGNIVFIVINIAGQIIAYIISNRRTADDAVVITPQSIEKKILSPLSIMISIISVVFLCVATIAFLLMGTIFWGFPVSSKGMFSAIVLGIVILAGFCINLIISRKG